MSVDNPSPRIGFDLNWYISVTIVHPPSAVPSTYTEIQTPQRASFLMIARTLTSSLATLALVSAARAQTKPEVHTRKLPAVFSEHADAFTSPGSVVPLLDGSVIVSDIMDGVVKRIDFTRPDAIALGRTGSGPGEYRFPAAVFQVPGDSVWILDMGNFRWLPMHVHGRFGAPVSLSRAPRVLTNGSVLGTDSRGRLYARVEDAAAATKGSGSTGQSTVIRADRTSWRIDTIGRLMEPKGRIVITKSEGAGYTRTVDNRPLWAEDAVAVLPTGDVALVRSADYHIDWVRSNGQRESSRPFAFVRSRVDEAEKQAYLTSTIRPGGILVVRDGSAPKPNRQERRPPPVAMTAADASKYTWPPYLPPFTRSTIVSPMGRIWIERRLPQSVAVRSYDVVDSSGELIERVEMPKSLRVAAVGREAVYVIRADEDDLQFVRRYEWREMTPTPVRRARKE